MIKIVRVEESDEGTFGVLLLDSKAFCVTLEPPDRDNQSNISNIPPDLYVAKRIISPKYGETFEITDVPGRSHILFHPGNIVDNTKGCVLVGHYFGKLRQDRAILNSGRTFHTFMLALEGKSHVDVTIVEV